MRERPIIMSEASVGAILDGRKTVTRRVVKPSRHQNRYAKDKYGGWDSPQQANQAAGEAACINLRQGNITSPYGGPGDLLWVKETWRAVERESDGLDGVLFRAGGQFQPIENTREAAEFWMDAYDNGKYGTKWRPSMYMPKWAARIWLEVTKVSVERVQDITEHSAEAEGMERTGGGRYWLSTDVHPVNGTRKVRGSARDAFRDLWDEINGKREGCAWSDNPWVWVVHFAHVDITQVCETHGRPFVIEKQLEPYCVWCWNEVDPSYGPMEVTK